MISLNEMIKLNSTVKGSFCIIAVSGVLDYSTMDYFNEEIKKIDPGINKVVIDFTELEFIDSTGSGSIINFVHEANEKNFSVELTGISQEVGEIFETIGVYQIMQSLLKEDL